jgi:hypothetical protein
MQVCAMFKRMALKMTLKTGSNCGFLRVGNVMQLPEGGDFGTLNYQQTMNLNRSTKPHNATEPRFWVGAVIGSCFSVNQFLTT